MALTELLSKVGDGNVQFQNLRQCISSIESRKDGSVAVTFHTAPDKINPTDEVMGRPEWVGLVVWLPQDRVKQAMDEMEGKP